MKPASSLSLHILQTLYQQSIILTQEFQFTTTPTILRQFSLSRKATSKYRSRSKFDWASFSHMLIHVRRRIIVRYNWVTNNNRNSVKQAQRKLKFKTMFPGKTAWITVRLAAVGDQLWHLAALFCAESCGFDSSATTLCVITKSMF